MTIHQKIDLLAKYKLREACILSGQVPEEDVAAWLREDPQFARWLTERALARQQAGSEVHDKPS